MVEQDTVGWICSFFVIGFLVITIIYEIIKRWRLSVRLVALDESLLQDRSIILEDFEPDEKSVPFTFFISG